MQEKGLIAPALVAARKMPGRAPSRTAIGIALAVLLHGGLLWFATRPLDKPVPDDHRVWVQLLRITPKPALTPQPDAVRVAPTAPAPPALARAAREPVSATSTPKAEPDSQPVIPPTPAPTQESPEERALMATASPAPAAPPSDALQQARQAAGAIDRQLRSEHPKGFSAPPDTSQTRLEKGLAAAHAAVPPKWFERARMELISAPNDPKKIYRVTTATGEFCAYYPDKASSSVNLSAQAGQAYFGQPTISTCPHPF